MKPINYTNIPQHKLELRIKIVQFGTTNYFGSFHLSKFLSGKSIQQFDFLYRSYQKLLKGSNGAASLPGEEKSDEGVTKIDRKNYKSDKLTVDIAEVMLLTNLMQNHFSYPKTHEMTIIVEVMIKCPSLDEALNLFIRKIFDDVQDMTAKPQFLIADHLIIINHFKEKQYISLPSFPTSSPADNSEGEGKTQVEESYNNAQKMKRQQILSILKSAIMNEYEVYLEAFMLMEDRVLPSYTFNSSEGKKSNYNIFLPTYRGNAATRKKGESDPASAPGMDRYDFYHQYYHNQTGLERYREPSAGFLTIKKKYKLTYIDERQTIKSFTKYPIESILCGVFHSIEEASLCVNTYVNHIGSMKRRYPEKTSEENKRNPKKKPDRKKKDKREEKKSNNEEQKKEEQSKEREDKETEEKEEKKEDEAEYKKKDLQLKASILMNEYISYLSHNIVSWYHSGEYYNMNEEMIQLQSMLEGTNTSFPSSDPAKEMNRNSPLLEQLCCIPTHLPRLVHPLRVAIQSFMKVLQLCSGKLQSIEEKQETSVLSKAEETLLNDDRQKLLFHCSRFSLVLFELKQLVHELIITNQHYSLLVALEPLFQKYFLKSLNRFISIPTFQTQPSTLSRAPGGRKGPRLPTIDDLHRLLSALATMDSILKHLELHASVEIVSSLFEENFQSYQISFESALKQGTDDPVRESSSSSFDNYHRYRNIISDLPRCLLDLFGLVLSKAEQHLPRSKKSSLTITSRTTSLPPLFASPEALEQFYAGKSGADYNTGVANFFSALFEGSEEEIEIPWEQYWRPFQIMDYYQQSSGGISSIEEQIYPPDLLLQLDYNRHNSMILNEDYMKQVKNPNLFDYYFYCSQTSSNRVPNRLLMSNTQSGGIIDHQLWLFQELDRTDFPASSTVLSEKNRLRYLYHCNLLSILYDLSFDLLASAKRYPRFLLTNLLFASKTMKYSFPRTKLVDFKDPTSEKEFEANDSSEGTKSSYVPKSSNQYLFATLKRNLICPLDHPNLKTPSFMTKQGKIRSLRKVVHQDRPYRISFPEKYRRYNRLFGGGLLGSDRLLSCLGPYSYESIFTAIWNLPPLLPTPPSSTIGFTAKYLMGMTAICGMKLAYKFHPEIYYQEEASRQEEKSMRRERRRKRMLGKTRDQAQILGVSNEERVLQSVKQYLQKTSEKEQQQRNTSKKQDKSWFGSNKAKSNDPPIKKDIKETSDEEETSSSSDEEEEEFDGTDEASTGKENIEEKSRTFISVDDGNLSIPTPYELELIYYSEMNHLSYLDKVRRAYSQQIILLIEFMISSPMLLFGKISFPSSSASLNSRNAELIIEERKDMVTFSLQDFLAELTSSGNRSQDSFSNAGKMQSSELYNTIEKLGFNHGKCLISGGMLQLPHYHSQRMTLDRLMKLFQDSFDQKIPANPSELRDNFDDVFEFNLSNQQKEESNKTGRKGFFGRGKTKDDGSERISTTISKKTQEDAKKKEKKRAKEEKEKKDENISDAKRSPREKATEGVKLPARVVERKKKRRNSINVKSGGNAPVKSISPIPEADDEEDDEDDGGVADETNKHLQDLNEDSSNYRYDPTYSDSNRIYKNAYYQTHLSKYYSTIPSEDFIYVPFQLQFNLLAVKTRGQAATKKETVGGSMSKSSSGASLPNTEDKSLSRDNSKEEFVDHSSIYVGRQEDLSRYLVSTIWFSKETVNTLWEGLLSTSETMTMAKYLSAEIIKLQQYLQHYYHTSRSSHLFLEYGIMQSILLQNYRPQNPSKGSLNSELLKQTKEDEDMTLEDIIFSFFHHISYKFFSLNAMIDMVQSQYVPHCSELQPFSIIAFERTIAQYVDLSWKYLLTSPNCLYFQGLAAHSMVLLDYLSFNNKIFSIPISYARRIQDYSPRAFHLSLAALIPPTKTSSLRKLAPENSLESSVTEEKRLKRENSSLSPSRRRKNVEILSSGTQDRSEQNQKLVENFWQEKKQSIYQLDLIHLNPYLIPRQIIAYQFPEAFSILENVHISSQILLELGIITEMMIGMYSKDLFYYYSSYTNYLLSMKKRFYSVEENLDVIFGDEIDRLVTLKSLKEGNQSEESEEEIEDHSLTWIDDEEPRKKDSVLEQGIRNTCQRSLQSLSHQETKRSPYFHFETIFSSNTSNTAATTEEFNNIFFEYEEDRSKRMQERLRMEESKKNAFSTIGLGGVKLRRWMTPRDIYDQEVKRWEQYHTKLQSQQQQSKQLLLLTNITKITKLKHMLQKMKGKKKGVAFPIGAAIAKVSDGESDSHKRRAAMFSKSSTSSDGEHDEEGILHHRDDDRSIQLEIQQEFQSKWRKEEEMDLFLSNSLYNKVLTHNDKLDFLSSFHDETLPVINQTNQQLLQHDPVSQYSLSTTGFQMIGNSVQSSLSSNPSSMLSLLRAYGNVYEPTSDSTSRTESSFSKLLPNHP